MHFWNVAENTHVWYLPPNIPFQTHETPWTLAGKLSQSVEESSDVRRDHRGHPDRQTALLAVGGHVSGPDHSTHKNARCWWTTITWIRPCAALQRTARMVTSAGDSLFGAPQGVVHQTTVAPRVGRVTIHAPMLDQTRKITRVQSPRAFARGTEEPARATLDEALRGMVLALANVEMLIVCLFFYVREEAPGGFPVARSGSPWLFVAFFER